MQACGRQCGLLVTQRLVPTADRTLVDRWLCENISLHGFCRVVGGSIRWLMAFVSACVMAWPDRVYVQPATSPRSAAPRWANIPAAYRAQATCDTDRYEAYKGVIPAAHHPAMTKKARKTNHIERVTNTLRQRVPRLVRDTLAFSKKLENHIGAIPYVICHDNLTRAAALHL
jgi:insertion element IS1 protein InsB